jgi:hypothetical protein
MMEIPFTMIMTSRYGQGYYMNNKLLLAPGTGHMAQSESERTN